MSLQRAKTIEKILTAYVGSSGLVIAVPVTSTVVTAAVGTTLATAGNGSTAVPVQVAAGTGAAIGLEQFTAGVITAGTNRALVYNNATKAKIVDGSSNEVYGRVTEAAGVYTLSYYSLIAGVETAFSMPAQTIDFLFPYRFTFTQFPSDAAIRVQDTFVGEDPASTGGRKIMQVVTVTALNTVSALGFTPIANTVQLVIQGHAEDQLAGGAFTVAGTVITWVPATAGYDLNIGDRVIAVYQTLS